MSFDGSLYWKFLHLYSINKDKWFNKINNFRFLNLAFNLIPCELCKNESLEYIQSNPIDDLENYLFIYHNIVNTKLYKPILYLNQYNILYNNYLKNTVEDFFEIFNEIIRLYPEISDKTYDFKLFLINNLKLHLKNQKFRSNRNTLNDNNKSKCNCSYNN